MGGLNSIQEICLQTKEYGATHIALTDTNGLYGIPEFLVTAKKIGLTPIIGCELRHKDFQFVVLVKNQIGYQSLCEYLTVFHCEGLDLDQSLNFLYQKNVDLVFFTPDKTVLLKMRNMNFSSFYFSLIQGFFYHRDYLWAKENGIKTLANNRVHYIGPENNESYKLMRAVADNTTLESVKIDKFHNEKCYLQSPHEMNQIFKDLYAKSLARIDEIALSLTSTWFEHRPISVGFNDLAEVECDEILYDKCVAKIEKRYENSDENTLERVHERLRYEMNIISKRRFSSYFLNVEDISSQCEYTCGRGSSAASIVNYLLEITHVDPIKENLLFDRFMNLDRDDPPDIDVDFPADQRDDVLDYIFEKFRGRAAMVANHNFLRAKSSIREVAKVYGIKEDEITYTLDRMEKLKLNALWHKIIYNAQKIEGAFRHLSVHCGGIVITPDRLDRYVPIEISNKGYPVIQWEKEQTQIGGLIKIDILANKGLSVIRDVINNINRRVDHKIIYQDLKATNDEKTRTLFKKGETIGVVHFESPRCQTLLAAFKDANLSTLSIVCSLIRPAAMMQINEMLRRFHGGVFHYPHPILEDVLGETKGIMVYQEDVMRVTKALANFTSQEGNELRKVLAKKHKEKNIIFYKEKFFGGCRDKGISEGDINCLWRDILSFSGYSFCKPHSNSYSLVAYKSAYLKVHYPAEFMAAVICNGGGFYVGNVEDYLNEARRLGIAILPPDINLSDYEYTGFKDEIRVGLKQIKHINARAIKKIQGERQKRPFISLSDFLSRVDLSFNDVRILVKARCFGSVRMEMQSEGARGIQKKLNHSEIMWRVYDYYAKKEGRISFDIKLPVLRDKIPEYNKNLLIRWEKKFLNGFVTFPSWFCYKDILVKGEVIAGVNLKYYLGKEVILYGQKVTQKGIYTKFKEDMAFVTFSDDTCMFNTVFFPRAYEQSRELLFLTGPYLIKGIVEKDFESFQVNVLEIQRLGGI